MLVFGMVRSAMIFSFRNAKPLSLAAPSISRTTPQLLFSFNGSAVAACKKPSAVGIQTLPSPIAVVREGELVQDELKGINQTSPDCRKQMPLYLYIIRGHRHLIGLPKPLLAVYFFIPFPSNQASAS